MKRFAPIVLILVLIGLLALLNKGINKNAGGDDGTPPPPPAAAKTTTPSTTTPSATATAADPLPSEMTLGSMATAPYKITVGWVYDSATQADPIALTQVINLIKQRVATSGGQAAAEIVNLDVPAGELSPQAVAVTGLGVAVNGDFGAVVGGKDIALAGNPGEGETTAANVGAVLDAALAAR